jgi:hypothetical protein
MGHHRDKGTNFVEYGCGCTNIANEMLNSTPDAKRIQKIDEFDT